MSTGPRVTEFQSELLLQAVKIDGCLVSSVATVLDGAPVAPVPPMRNRT
jgi:hypothetical protein